MRRAPKVRLVKRNLCGLGRKPILLTALNFWLSSAIKVSVDNQT
jgi:hypothetical protein